MRGCVTVKTPVPSEYAGGSISRLTARAILAEAARFKIGEACPLLRKLAARLAYELAVDTMNRAETSHWLRDYISLRGRSRWWSDAEQALTGGFGTFTEIRARRRNIAKEQAARRRVPHGGSHLTIDVYGIEARA